MKAAPQIYVKGSVEAVAFYRKAFDLTLGMTGFNPDGTYEHASLMSGDICILSVAENPEKWSYQAEMGAKWPHMSFNIYELGTNEAVDHAYAVLIEGARNVGDGPGSPCWDTSNEHYGFDVVDKFGVYWGFLGKGFSAYTKCQAFIYSIQTPVRKTARVMF